MNDLSAGVEETSASTYEVTETTSRQADITNNLMSLSEEIVLYSNQLNEKLAQFQCE